LFGENETDYRYVCSFCIIIIYLFVCIVSMLSGMVYDSGGQKAKNKFSGKFLIESELELYDLGVAVMLVVIFV